MLQYRMPTIAQRDLRNRSAEILRETERGTTYVITVGGRPVAQLQPIARRQWVSRAEVQRLLLGPPPDPTLEPDLARASDRLDPRRDPWTRRAG